MATRIRDLLDLPEEVRRTDFVVEIKTAFDHVADTVRTYVATPDLVRAMEDALRVARGVIDGGQSEAAYVHGSYGSGKSHFLAMLGLLLQNDPGAWARGEFHPLRDKAAFVQSRKLLVVPVYFVGAPGFETQVFRDTLDRLRKLHPTAPLPPVFKDEALFDSAEAYRQQIGDRKFFDDLNAGDSGPTDGWGQEETWTPGRFQAARASGDLDARATLFRALLRLDIFKAWTSAEGFVDLATGLARLSVHAKRLGYAGIVFLMDELILWMMGYASSADFVSQQSQHLAQLLVRHPDGVPFVTYIARQRNLAEVVGEHATGIEQKNLRNQLEWLSGRIGTITLSARNLADIVAQRVLKARSPEAGREKDAAFESFKAAAGTSWPELLGETGSEADFKKLYPFTPASIEVLVALSDFLQRERTAIRILTELLVGHMHDLELGQVLPVGDLFDIVAAGDPPMDGVIKDHFLKAKEVYAQRLLPLIQAHRQTADAWKCQRLRPEHRPDLGCSLCAERACRNDNRLAKTMLLTFLVPGIKTCQNLTVRRLVAINHGSLRAPIPGGEAKLAADRIRDWQRNIEAVHIGDEGDPRVEIKISAIEIGPILDQAKELDSPGAQKRMIQRLLVAELGLPETEQDLQTVEFRFRGARKAGTVLFGNVREQRETHYRPGPGDAFRILVDHPFDEPGHGPTEDESRLDEFLKGNSGGAATVAWLPVFFSEATRKLLGELVILHALLDHNRWRDYVRDARPEEQGEVHTQMRYRFEARKKDIVSALEKAYGILPSPPGDRDLDTALRPEQALKSLLPDLEIPAIPAAKFGPALEQIAFRILEHRFPNHPDFQDQPTRGRLARVLQVFESLVERPDGRGPLPSDAAADLKKVGAPLGLVRVTETAVHLERTRLNEIEQRRIQSGKAEPTVEDLRRFLDPAGKAGFDRNTQDCLILGYARLFDRAFRVMNQDGRWPEIGEIEDEARLVTPTLPAPAAWEAAVERAEKMLSISDIRKHRSARNAAALAQAVTKRAKELREPLAEAARRAGERCLAFLGRKDVDRVKTLDEAARLADDLAGRAESAVIERLAAVTLAASLEALQRAATWAQKIRELLADEYKWAVLGQVRDLRDDPGRGQQAQLLIGQLLDVLSQDEVVQGFVPKFHEITEQARKLVKVRTEGWVPLGEPVLGEVPDPGALEEQLRKGIDALVSRARSAEEGPFRYSIRLEQRRRKDEGS